MVQLLQDDMYRRRLQHSSFATPLGYCDKQNLYMSIPSGRRYELLPKERLKLAGWPQSARALTAPLCKRKALLAGLRNGARNLPVRAADALTCAMLRAVCLAPVALPADLKHNKLV